MEGISHNFTVDWNSNNISPYPTGTPSFVRQSKVVEAPGPDRNAQLPTQSAQMPFAEETFGSQKL